MTAEFRRGIALAGLGLAGGVALVVALFGTGEFLKRSVPAAAPPVGGDAPSRDRTPLAALPGDPGATGGRIPLAGPGGAPQGGSRGSERGDEAERKAPVLDVVRVEPDGETVVAGRAEPNATVELLRDGQPVTSAVADAGGQFALLPPPLPPGSHEITLRARNGAGTQTPGRQSVAVVVGRERTTKPLIAVSDPDKPTLVLSRPEAPDARPGPEAVEAGPKTGPETGPKTGPGSPANRTAALPPAAEPKRAGSGSGERGRGGAPAGGASREQAKSVQPVKVVAIDAQEGGRLDVSGQAAPNATLRLYLNDTLVASGKADGQGRLAFTIGRGVRAGSYQVRVDQVDAATARVMHRAEVAFTVPGEGAPRVALRGVPSGPEPLSIPRPSAGAPAERPSAGGADGTDAKPSLGRPAGASRTPEATASVRPGPVPGGTPEPSREAAASVGAVPQAADGTAGGQPGTVFVAEISTARIVRGDSLWQISRRTYGKGNRYTVIYDANQDQIRDPDRIYPGQMFVLPQDATPSAAKPVTAKPAGRG